MIAINVFKVEGDPASLMSAYNWPDQPLPTGRLIGKQGNALLMELSVGGVAVISAPLSELHWVRALESKRYWQRCGAPLQLPLVDLSWAFA